jgi:hypothetical protein
MSEFSNILYVSTASELMTPQELAGMLRAARQRNQENGITGLLLYRGGNFLQYFEGPPEAVATLHARIRRDPRHYGVITVHEGQIAARQFPAWSMGFDDLNGVDAERLDGFSDFLRTGFRDQTVLRDLPFMLRFLEHFAGRT